MEQTTELTRQQLKKKELAEFAELLKANGYTVLVPGTDPFKWLTFYKDGNFGYVDGGYYSGYNFSSVHKPSREAGTGFGVAENADLTLENADKCMIDRPKWFKRNKSFTPQKYSSVEEFLNAHEYAKYYTL